MRELSHPLLRRIARLLLLTQVVALALVTAAAVALFLNIQRFQQANARVDHTHQVLGQIARLRTSVLRGGLALRDHAIAPRTALLERARAAASEATAAGRQLDELIEENPVQRNRVHELRSETAELVGWILSAAVIAERDGGPPLQALLLRRAKDDGARSFRELLIAIESEENQLLQRRSASQQLEFGRLKEGIVLAGAAFLAFLLWGIVHSSRLFRLSHRDIEGLRSEADHDPLTRLLNRRALEKQFEKVADRPLTVVAMDLDHFKPVNDTYGHDAGDEVLRVTAERLREQCRDLDLIARVGGDEFIVVLAGIGDPQRAVAVCDRLTLALSQPVAIGSFQVRIGASVGHCVSPGGVPLKTLLVDADAMAYATKFQRRERHRGLTPDMAAPASAI